MSGDELLLDFDEDELLAERPRTGDDRNTPEVPDLIKEKILKFNKTLTDLMNLGEKS